MSYDPDLQSKSKEKGVGGKRVVIRERRKRRKRVLFLPYFLLWVFYFGFTASRLQPFLSLFSRRKRWRVFSPFDSPASSLCVPRDEQAERRATEAAQRRQDETNKRRRGEEEEKKKRFEYFPSKMSRAN
jgi:hypothetical protein